MLTSALAYASAYGSRFIDELREFVRIPSVSADPARAADVRRCADWLAGHLRGIGLGQVGVVATPGHPIVHAAWRGAPGRPTVLIYGHYDVQPPGQLAEWRTPPFEPALRGNELFGRGASDDKGPLFAHIKAIESWMAARGRLPVNVACFFEGEEETGSRHFTEMLRQGDPALAADVAVVSDTRMLGPNRPAITYALRGSLSLEIDVRGLGHDGHSGAFGGAVPNALEELAQMLARMHDSRGRVAIPGFYDRVASASEAERAYLAQVGPSDAELLASASASHSVGEAGYSLYERTTIRPALTVTGLSGGYGGPGSMSSIPARAKAKLNMRLVPDQDPIEIDRLVRRFVATTVPATVVANVRTLAAAPPVVVDACHPLLRAAATAYERAFGSEPVFVRSGGSIPIVGALRTQLRIPMALMGFALPDDRMHGPNEKLNLPTFHRAVATCIHFMGQLGGRFQVEPGLPALVAGR